jgi:hypothetical protein
MKLTLHILAFLLVHLDMGINEGHFLYITFIYVEVVEQILDIRDIVGLSVR